MASEHYQLLAIIVPPLSVLIGRIWSMIEHRKTGREITEIKLTINGELEKRISQAKEEGRQEVLNEIKNKSL